MESTAACGGQLEPGALTHVLKKHIMIFSGSFPDVEMRKEYTLDGGSGSSASSIMLSYHKHAFELGGAHESGKLGEDPKGIPNNLMPYIQQVVVGRLLELNVYGTDCPTSDGTAVRDYIHVMDLADGHVVALQKLLNQSDIGCVAYKLGTGKGKYVLEMIVAFERASEKKISLKMCPRKLGDATVVYTSTEKTEKELG